MRAGKEVEGRSNHHGNAWAVFPVGEIDDEGNVDDDVLCAPCEGEEEEAIVPSNLPTVYQPTHSEYLDHSVTHYP